MTESRTKTLCIALGTSFFVFVACASFSRKIPPPTADEVVRAKQHFSEAESLLAEGKHRPSIAEYTMAIDLDPGNAVYYLHRGKAHFTALSAANDLSYWTTANRFFDIDMPFLDVNLRVVSIRHKIKQAFKDFTRAIKLDPKNPVPLAYRGYLRSVWGDHRHARKDFKRVLKSGTNSREAVYLSAIQLARKGNISQAVAFLRRISVEDTTDPLPHFLAGFVFVGAQNIPEAQKRFESAIQADSTRSEGFIGWGACLLFQEKNREAIQAFKKAIALMPTESSLAWASLGLAFLSQDIDSAYVAFIRATEIDSMDHFSHCQLGKLDFRMRRFRSSIEHYSNAIRAEPFSKSAYVKRAYAYLEQNRDSLAEDDAKKAKKLAPRDCDVFSVHASIANHRREFESAIAYCDSALQADSNNCAALVAKGRALAGRYRWKKAHPFFEKARYLCPGTIYSRIAYIESCRMRSDRTLSDEFAECKSAIADFPYSPLPLHRLGKAYERSREYSNAKACYLLAIAKDSTFLPPYIDFGLMMRRVYDNPDSAIHIYRKAMTIDSTNQRILYGLSSAYERKGNYTKALGFRAAILQLCDSEECEGGVRWLRASLYSKAGMHDSAIADCDFALSQDPRSWNVLAEKAEVLLNAGDYIGAIEYAGKAIAREKEIESFNARNYLIRYQAYLKLGESDSAWRELNAGTRQKMNEGKALVTRASLNLEASHSADNKTDLLQKALKDCSTAVSRNPYWIRPQQVMAEVLVASGRIDEAIEICNAYQKRRPYSPMSYKMRAEIYEKCGRIKNALVDYATYLKMKDDPEIRNRLKALTEKGSDPP